VTDLYGESATVQLRPRPQLPASAAEYKRGRNRRRREPADPIGLEGLPETRGQLDNLLVALCGRLMAAGGEFVKGRRLVAELEMRHTRALRLLAAYGRVQHRLRQIVALPGLGYVWGDDRVGIYGQAARCARRMALCHLYLGSLFRKRPAQIELAQMVLEFTGQTPLPQERDELEAWMAAEQVQPGQVLDAVIESFGRTEAGRHALHQAARKHAELLISAELADDIEAKLAGVLADIRQARRRPPEPASTPG